MLRHTAIAVESFAELITAQVSANAEQAEARLMAELAVAGVHRERLAHLLLADAGKDAAHWQLHGALLAEIDRVLDELGVEKRSQRLFEELDAHTRTRRTRHLGQRLRSRGRRGDEGAPSS